MIRREGMVLSPYIALYDIIISKDHELRQLNELVDFSFRWIMADPATARRSCSSI